MGTRHLIAVKVEGQYRVAQYGQWDGYPEGQGVSVLAFLKQMHRESFIAKVKLCHYGTKEEFEKIQADHADDWSAVYPQLSRDAGADVLSIIDKSEGCILKDSISFASDSLFCEFAYIIDFDTNILEVLRGFSKSPLDKSERFADFPKSDEYYPIRSWKKFDLSNLPAEDEFLKELTDE